MEDVCTNDGIFAHQYIFDRTAELRLLKHNFVQDRVHRKIKPQ
jgi:hypothetical protein